MHVSKAGAQIAHALRRGSERYSSEFGFTDLMNLKDMIQGVDGFDRKTTIFIDRQSNRVSRWRLWYKGEWVSLVYDNSRRTVVTFLPKGTLDHLLKGSA